MNNRLYDIAMAGMIAGAIGFFAGSYVGKQDGLRESEATHYLRGQFERRYEEVDLQSAVDRERLEVFMTGKVPEKPVANLRSVLERIAREGEKPRDLIASSE